MTEGLSHELSFPEQGIVNPETFEEGQLVTTTAATQDPFCGRWRLLYHKNYSIDI